MHILTQVIQDFSLSICSGQTVAIVGPSGGGKTTLANLIQRFYDLDKGEVHALMQRLCWTIEILPSLEESSVWV